ncbi:hypothetical protein C8R44DRAFT_745639 [Mycena epipterygia]|nr:hypothetical protein C8R44DRAFT_745639 [Mycena epipterygia]
MASQPIIPSDQPSCRLITTPTSQWRKAVEWRLVEERAYGSDITDDGVMSCTVVGVQFRVLSTQRLGSARMPGGKYKFTKWGVACAYFDVPQALKGWCSEGLVAHGAHLRLMMKGSPASWLVVAPTINRSSTEPCGTPSPGSPRRREAVSGHSTGSVSMAGVGCTRIDWVYPVYPHPAPLLWCPRMHRPSCLRKEAAFIVFTIAGPCDAGKVFYRLSYGTQATEAELALGFASIEDFHLDWKIREGSGLQIAPTTGGMEPYKKGLASGVVDNVFQEN